MGAVATAVGNSADLAEMYGDPYPFFARARTEDPVCWVPALDRYLVTRYDDVVALERQPEIFSANEEGSLMTQVMGHTLLRKDGAAHRRERAAAERGIRPRTVANHWQPIFQRNADDLLDGLVHDRQDRGSADLFTDYAGPLAARNLLAVLGLQGVSDQEIQIWSQAMIDGGGSNYADDPAVRDRAVSATQAIDEAVLENVARLREHPDESVISGMLTAEDPLTLDQIRADVKVFVGGGLNEPRDSLLTAVQGVLSSPAVHDTVRSAGWHDTGVWREVFEEAVRWVAPIGMYPRQVVSRVQLGGVWLEPGDKVGVCLGSANRDERVFDRPDEFRLGRPRQAHVAFGGGPHFCVGAWVARSQVAQVGLPSLFARLEGLRLSEELPVRVGGWVFRGPLTVPVVWSSTRSGDSR